MRGVEPVGGNPPAFGQERPRERDGVRLEVVAEREVPEHLEERVVAERRPHVLEVVVLPAHAHALLRARGPAVLPPLAAQEDVLELVHAGVREQQRLIAGRHERGASDDAVTVLFEVHEE